MYLANKNILHNNAYYKAGDEVPESVPGFKDLLQAGHLSQSAGKKVVEEKPIEPPAPPMPEVFVDEEPSDFSMSKKSKKKK